METGPSGHRPLWPMEWVRSGEAARDDAKMHLDQQFVGWEQAGEGVQEDPLDVIIVGWTWRTAPVIGSLRNFLRPSPMILPRHPKSSSVNPFEGNFYGTL